MKVQVRLITLAIPVAMVVGCAAQSGPDRSLAVSAESDRARPLATIAPTVMATPAPTSTVTAAPFLRPDGVAQVVTTDLVVRSAPGVSAESEIYADLLNEPTLLFVLDGPVAADGYDWWLVEPFSRDVCIALCPAKPPLGWVAQAGTDGEPWIAPATLDCPEPVIGEIGRLSPTARLACYGNDTLVLEGTLGDCYAAETPVALQQSGCQIRPVEGVTPFLIMRAADGVGMPMDQPGVRMTVTGHFDDASASSCQWSSGFNNAVGNPAEPPSPEAVILGCRQEFVVTDIAVAGE